MELGEREPGGGERPVPGEHRGQDGEGVVGGGLGGGGVAEAVMDDRGDGMELGPPVAILSGGNRNDVTQLIPLLQAVPSVRGKSGRPRHRPDVVLGDRGYDHGKYHRLVWGLGVKPPIARRGTEHGSGPGAQRWFVERAFAHLHCFRRLRIRWEIRDDSHEAFLTRGCALTCRRHLRVLEKWA
ncbi:transposase [Streptomyces sp. NPDC014734]|uniref:transposase n=1 Tax=Streptomyces sp. NPDC014734 TaxID=3364886 RepID=UPI0037036928